MDLSQLELLKQIDSRLKRLEAKVDSLVIPRGLDREECFISDGTNLSLLTDYDLYQLLELVDGEDANILRDYITNK